MSAPKAFYITTAISYPNGPPHIGHAYEVITTDVIARYKRLDGYDVRFLTGVDDHGQKMAQTAKAKGTTPQALADEMAPKFLAMDERLNISNDDFIRTTEARHEKACQHLWEKIAAKGDIYTGTYSGWYSVRDEAFYDEDELTTGEGGQKLAPGTGTPVEWMEEETYFFRLSAYQEKLLALYESQPDFIQPASRRNEILAFVKRGLNDLSISRARTKLDWGVGVPGDPNHVMYVWIDALTNYITGLGYPDMDGDLFKRYWPADMHIIGKDIVRFHAVIWPAMLMAAEVALPKRVFGHGFLNVRGEKMSKSVGNVIDPFTITDTYGVDPIRYFFCREVTYGADGSYSHDTVVNRINADLANDIGNLAQRSLSMIAKNCGGEVPAYGAFTAEDKAVLDAAAALPEKTREQMERLEIHSYVGEVFAVVSEANRYFAGQEPWALKKTDPERMGTVLYVTAEVVRRCALMLQPVMPASIAKLLDLLAVPEGARAFSDIAASLTPGTALPAPAGVFPRYVEPEALSS
ncbi:methionyl-tRNA synthetase [Parvibaculum lavamentivorans DS-1]|uniref:Methionine--tRNA ligase n=1 Tax=Parvibaculum lavamentivorans (strain DS-1 / DSM 13023 / NCIMB 13966) TaxID=402881 RepID=A7HXT7_PARL1|nr:methionine--tRNA ligase [Parvibaculum lavamentivorans]ABS64720.1 methionyl-tRNA synthetase [Parvibaculum lavamentivorans DS-1]